jgi:large subunit ribosomal protein L24
MRGKFLSSMLDKPLREMYKRRSLRVVKGDTVKVLRGDSKGHEGVVDEVNTRSLTLVVHGVSATKSDGTEVPRPVDPSNVKVTKLNLEDPRREERLEVKA